MAAYLFTKAFMNRSASDMFVFGVLVVIPFFVIFKNFYFLVFLIFRPVFDALLRAGINPNSAATLFFIAVYFWVLLLDKRDLKVIRSNSFLRKFNFIFSLLLGFAVISSLNSASPLDSVADIFRLLSLALLVNYAGVYTIRNPDGGKKIIKVILFSSLLPVFFGLYQLIFQKGLYLEGFNRVFGSFVHPNVFSEYLFVIFFILLFRILSGKREGKNKQGFKAAYLSLIILLIFNTFTRNVWIALFFSLGAFFLLGRDLLKKVSVFFWGLIVLLPVFPFILIRFSDLTGKSSQSGNSWEWRMELWNNTLGQVFQHPVIGHGLGTFQIMADVPAHNDYLRISYELGFLGLALYLLLISTILMAAYKKATLKLSPFLERKKAICIFCIFLGFLIISFADNLARSTVVLIYGFVFASVYLSTVASEEERLYDENIIRK